MNLDSSKGSGPDFIPVGLLNNCEKKFIWLLGKRKNPKINSALCNGYQKGGIKNVDLRNKIISMQCLWIKRLFEDYFYDWKVIPLFLIGKQLGKNFKFHNKEYKQWHSF